MLCHGLCPDTSSVKSTNILLIAFLRDYSLRPFHIGHSMRCADPKFVVTAASNVKGP